MREIIEGYGEVQIGVPYPPLKMLPEVLTCEKKYVNFLDPDPTAMTNFAIARGLSCESRFGGQLGGLNHHIFYSVAQHSVNVAQLLKNKNFPRDIVLQGLFHDAAEAFMKDLPSPLKQLFPLYRELEKNMLGVIMESRGLGPYLHSEVIRADQIMLILEACEFQNATAADLHVTQGYPQFPTLPSRNDWHCTPWSPSFAEAQFHAMFEICMRLPNV